MSQSTILKKDSSTVLYRRWFAFVAIVAVLFSAQVTNAQQKSRMITGLIRAAEDQQPIQGVSVLVKGTKNISGSQEDGVYYIGVQPSDSTLVFTHPDYEQKEFLLTHETEYNVELKKKRHR